MNALLIRVNYPPAQGHTNFPNSLQSDESSCAFAEEMNSISGTATYFPRNVVLDTECALLILKALRMKMRNYEKEENFRF
jgi:hypothetical protein